jgi:phage tail tube protein FII
LKASCATCDDDDDDDDDDEDFFCISIVMEHRWKEIDRGEPKHSEKNLS